MVFAVSERGEKRREMTQQLLTVRVRPARLAILIASGSTSAQFIQAVRFLSQIWGGRYCPILPVDPDVADPLTRFRLRTHRPDFVYGLGLNDTVWSKVASESCQPRRYGALTQSIAEDVRKLQFEDFIRVDRAVIAMFEARRLQSRLSRPLKVVSVHPSLSQAPFCAAQFGFHHPNLADEFRDESIDFTSDDAAAFVDICRDFVESWKVSWIDATGFRLTAHHIMSPPVEPTIVLVDDVVADLSQFWNLRIASDADEPAWIIPVPFSQASDLQVLNGLKEWLAAFSKFGQRPNYCIVTSQSVAEQACADVASRLAKVLEHTAFKFVDYRPPQNRLARVLPYESATTCTAELDGRCLTFMPPSPSAFRGSAPSESWFVDILDDANTNRAVGDIQLPESLVVPELLNGPCPPNFEQSVIPRFGDGSDSINVRCSRTTNVIRFLIPSPDEVLEELLREHGYEIIHDEKRSSYIPTIDRFGSLHRAAEAFVGQSGEILRTLMGRTLLPDEIRSACKLGSSELAGNNYLAAIDMMLRHESDRTRRIARKRFENFADSHTPEKRTLGALLEHWADKSILTRCWQLGPCRRCNQKHFEERLDIQCPILCPNCGNRMSLPERVRVGYSLDRPVEHSLKEGIIPIVLAGRFLRNMTTRGFFWLPGVKYHKGGIGGDIDFLACCDGLLIFGEAKTSPRRSDVWNQATDQFLELAGVAQACNAALVVFAAQVPQFPSDVSKKIEAELTGKIPFLLLNNGDLELGFRQTSESGAMSRLAFGNLIPAEFPEQPIRRTPGVRQIELGWGVFTAQS